MTPWTVAHQAPLSMGFSRQEYWSGLPCPYPGNLPDPGIKPRSPTLQADSLLFELPRKQNQTAADIDVELGQLVVASLAKLCSHGGWGGRGSTLYSVCVSVFPMLKCNTSQDIVMLPPPCWSLPFPSISLPSPSPAPFLYQVLVNQH